MATDWVDFKTVKEQVSMLMVLDHYGVNWLQKSGSDFRGRCPIHGGEGEGNSFHVSPEKNAFKCFSSSCGKKGNVLDFVAAMEQCSLHDAALKISEWFNVCSGDSKTESPKKQKKRAEKAARVDAKEPVEKLPEGEFAASENKPLMFELQGIDPVHSYLPGRGINKETAERFGLGFFPGKGSMSGRVVIPIHNQRGELLAYAGRSINGDDPKYKFPAGFLKSLELYNLHRAISWGGAVVPTVVLVEGFFGCIAVHEAGYPCVALMGSSMSKEQEKLLCHHFSGVVLLLDSDEAGRKGTDDCLLRLGRRIWVKALTLADGEQPDNLSAENIQKLLAS